MKTAQITAAILKLNKPAIVAISGFGGSGKSTLARLIASEIHAPMIGIDLFFKSVDQTAFQHWEIMDFERLEQEVLQPFISGNTMLSYGKFNWEKNEVVETQIVQVNDLIIIEGVGLLRPELMKYFAYTIWIECPIEVAIERGKKRCDEYGSPQDELWDGIWRDNDLQCYREYLPMEIADCVVECLETEL